MPYRTNYPYATTSQHNDAQFHSRDEQRRRQQEYFQALSQQVAQQEQQKRLERGLYDQKVRRNEVFPQRQEAFELAERGIFDGLGQNNSQKGRKSFARGQPQPYKRMSPEKSFNSWQVDQYPPQVRMKLPSGHSLSAQHRTLDDYQRESPGQLNDYQTLQPPQRWPESTHKDPINNVGLESSVQALAHNPSHNLIAQSRNGQLWADPGIPAMPPGYSGHESSPQKFHAEIRQDEPSGDSNTLVARRRSAFLNGDQGDAEEAERLRRKVQQQHEMQLALERQIEEKRQQKLEAKRKQDEEDRLELKRFEEDQRRLRAEQERIEDEKRRKAEVERQKADQAAAAVAAASLQAKRQQQQKFHAQFGQAPQEHYRSSSHLEQMEPVSNVLSFDRLKNPFTNSRAHLFEDPRPQRSPHQDTTTISSHDKYDQNASFRDVYIEHGGKNDEESPTELRRKYDDLREELKSQKQLVDQLRHAQAQIQHHQQQQASLRVESETAPTQEDLEILCNELREELAYREQLHRQEMDLLKREQQPEQRPADSRDQFLEIKHSFELPTFTKMVPDENAKSLRGESTFVYYDSVGENQTGFDQEDEEALDENSELIQVEPMLARRSNCCSEELCGSSSEAATLDGTKGEDSEAADTDSEDDAVEFNVTGIGSSPSNQSSNSLLSANSRRASSHRYSQLPPALSRSSHTKDLDEWRLKSIGTNNASDSDDELEETLDGDLLDALFQRNVRRHEILLGFQNKVNVHLHDGNDQGGSESGYTNVAWTDLHQQLENNRQTFTIKR